MLFTLGNLRALVAGAPRALVHLFHCGQSQSQNIGSAALLSTLGSLRALVDVPLSALVHVFYSV